MPQFDMVGLRLVDFTRVRVVLRHPDGSLALDTVVDFPAESTAITLTLPVVITTAEENLGLNMQMINAAGDTVFRAGPVEVTAVSGSLPVRTSEPPVRYVGVGSNATGVRFVTVPGEAYFQDTITFLAEAFDQNGQAIAGTPIVYQSLDTTRLRVPDPTAGRAVASTERGPARLIARLLTPDTVQATVAIQPRPNAIVVSSGNAQSGTVGQALALPLVAQVNALDNLGVQGVMVRFAVTAGGGTLSVDSMVTDSLGRASTIWTLGTSPGGQSVTATGAGLTGGGASVGFSATAVVGAVKQLVFTQQPTTTDAGQPITPAITVAARDTFGNTVTSFTGNVTMTIATNPAGGTLSGTTTQAAASGIATFAGLSIDQSGTGYTLQAASGSIAATSTAFNINATTPVRLEFVQEPPASVTAGAAISPAVTVRILDAQGNLVSSATDSVMLALGANPGSATLAGATKVAAVAGVATFGDLSIDSARAGYTLVASSGSLTTDTTAAFAVVPGAAQTLHFTLQPPSPDTAGTTFGVTVTARDSKGNTATGFASSVTLGFANNPTGDTLPSGALTVTGSGGVAAFTGLSLRKAGSGYQFQATATGLTTGVSDTFAVVAAAASAFDLTITPATGPYAAGSTFALVATARDAFGNVATTFASDVTITSAATIVGTTSATAASGVVTFTGLHIDQAGSYNLISSGGGITADTVAVVIQPAAAAALAFTQQPTSAEAGITLTTVRLEARDAFGNVVTSYADSVKLSLGVNPASDSLLGTVTLVTSGGVVEFPGLRLRKAATGVRIDAASGSLTATGTAFTVAPGQASALVFTTQPPASSQAGAAIAATVTARDSLGNAATSFAGTVGLALLPSGGGATLGGTTSVAASGGVASFTGLTVDKTGTGYTLSASATGPSSATSTAFSVTPAAASRLAFTTEPPATDTAGSPFTVAVAARDSFGNLVETFASDVTLALLANPGGATLAGTLTVTAASGIATFSTPFLNKAASGYTLRATATGLASDTSTALTIVPAAPAVVVFTQEPSNTEAGLAIAPTVQAAVQDAYANTVTSFSDTIALALAVSPTGDTLSGTVRAAASAGIASFGTVRVRKAGAGYRIRASSGALAADTSVAFTVTPGAATNLAFTTQPPASSQAGAAIAATVTARDSLGNVATGFAGTVGIVLLPGGSGATLGGTTSVAAASGVASFTGLTVDRTGTGYSFSASATGPTAATSTAFAVTPAAAARLVITTEPPATDTAGSPFTVVVAARDSLGNAVETFASDVTLALLANPGGATLSGTLTVTAVGGLATFTTPYLDKAASGYTLRATAAALAPDTSTAIAIVPAAPVAVVITQEPATTEAGLVIAPTVQAAVRDAYANTVTSFSDTIALALAVSPTGDTLSGTVRAAASAGIASFGTVRVRKAGAGYRIRASSGALAADTSVAFTVTPGGATNLAFTTQPPTSTQAGSAFTTAVTARDSLGNTATGFANAVTIALGTNPVGGTLGGVTSVSPSAGVATFTSPFVDKASSGYQLSASATSVTAGSSDAFTITPGPASTITVLLGDKQVDTVSSGLTDSLVARVTDGYNNPIAGHTVNWNVTFGGGAVSSASTTADATGRVAVAWTMGAYRGRQTLQASGSGLTAFTFEALATPLGMTKRWVGVTSDWSGAGNWLPAGAPGITDHAFVPAAHYFAPNGPSLSANAATKVLRAETGSTIQAGAFTLTVDSILDVATVTNTSGGKVAIRALNGGSARGTVGDLFMDNAYAFSTTTVSGRLAVTGRLSIPNNTGVTVGTSDTLETADTEMALGSLTVNGRATVSDTLIAPGGGVAVAGTLTVGTLVQSGTTITGAGTVDIVNRWDWSSGSLTDPGTIRALAGSTVYVTGSSNRDLNGVSAQRVVEIGGSAVWAGSAWIRGGLVTVRVLSGGSLDVQGDGAAFRNAYAPSGLIVENQGTLTKSVGTSTFTIDGTFTSTGSIAVSSGRLALGGSGTISGSVAVGSNDTLEVYSGSFGFDATSSVSGAGLMRLAGGTATLGGSYAIGATRIESGSLVVNTPATSTTGSLVVSNGTQSGTGTLEVAGNFDWTFGTLSGTGTTRVLAGGGGTWSSSTKTLNTRTVELADTVTWTAGAISGSNGAVLRVLAGGVFDAQANASFSNAGGTQPVIDNLGTVRRSAGTGTATFAAAFNSSGAVNVTATTLSLSGGGTSSGSFSAASPAVVEFSGGTHTLSGAFSGTGEVNFSGGSATLTGSYAVSGTTRVSGATASFNGGTTATTGALVVSNGTLGGTGTLEVSGLFDWTFGTLSGTGTTRVLAGGGGTWSSSTKTLNTRTVELADTVTWTAGAISGSNGAVLRVLAGGVFDAQANATFSNVSGTQPVLDNLGTVRRSGGTGTATIAAAFNSSGAVNVTATTLSLSGGGTSSGSFSAASPAVVEFSGGTHTLSGAFSGTGTIEFSSGSEALTGSYAVSGTTRVSGGTASFNGGATATTGALVVSGGTLGGTGTVEVSGLFDWTFGTLSGTGTTRVLAGGGGTWSSSTKTLNTRTVELADTVTWTAGGISGSNGAVLRVLSGGVFDAQANATFSNAGGTQPVLDNLGTVRRSAGTGTATIAAAFNSSGAVNVTATTLSFSGGGTSSGSFAATSPAVVDFSGGTHTLSGTFSGTGTIEFSGGTASLSGAYGSVGQTTISGATANFNQALAPATTGGLTVTNGSRGGTATLEVSGTFDWQFGSLTGSGTTRVLSSGMLELVNSTKTLSGGHTLENLSTAATYSAGTLQFSSGSLVNGAGAIFDISGNVTMANISGTNRLTNLGTLRRSTTTGSATIDVPVTNSVGGKFEVLTGTLNIDGGGSFSDSLHTVALGATLDFGGATDTLTNAFRVGGSGVTLLSTGTMLVGSGLSVKFSDFTQTGGTLSNAGTVLVTDTLNWQFGTITGTGTTRVAGATSVLLLNNSTKTLSGGQLLDNQSAAGSWSAGTLQFSGATLQNSAGAVLDLTGNVTMSNVSGTNRLTNLGTLRRSTTTGNATIDVPMTNSIGGKLDVLTGTLNIDGGGSFSDSLHTVATGATLDFGGATDTLNAGFVVGGAGTVMLSVGTLLVPASSTPNTLVKLANYNQASGTLDNRDTLTVSGTLRWQFGTITGAGGVTRTAGATSVMTLDNSTKTLNGGHTLLLGDGTAGVTGTWSSGTIQVGTAATTTTFRISSGATLDVTGNVTMNSVAGTNALNVQGSLVRSTTTGTASIGVPVTNSGVVSVTSGTLNLENGSTWYSGGSISSGAVLDVSGGSHKLFSPATFTGLGLFRVSSDTLDLAGYALTFAGGFATTTAGVLRMDSTADTLIVAGSASFAGGSTSGSLTAGAIKVGGNFTQPSSSNAFVATGNHTVIFNGSGAQTVTFANPASSGFRHVRVARSGTDSLTLASDMPVSGNFEMTTSDDTVGGASGRLIVFGDFNTSAGGNPVVRPRMVRLGGTTISLASTGFLAPDSLEFFGTNQTLPSLGVTYKNILVTGTASATSTLAATGDLVISSGQFTLGTNGNVTVKKLRTLGSGTLVMQTSGTTLIAQDSAVFAGGSTDGLLTNGVLRVVGNLSQSGSTTSFAATSGHRTVLTGVTGTQRIKFANPSTSHFADLELQGDSFQLESDVVIEGRLLTDPELNLMVRTLIGRWSLSMMGAWARRLVFDSLTVGVFNGAAWVGLDSILFKNTPTTVAQFTFYRSGDSAQSYSMDYVTFQTAPTSGWFIAVENSGAQSYAMPLNITNGSSVVALEGSGTQASPQYVKFTPSTGASAPILNWNAICYGTNCVGPS